MGRIVVTEYVSLDGVMQAPGGGEDFQHAGWTFEIDRGEEGDKFKLDETLESKALLLGRVTYEGFAAAWPSMEGEFADKFNSMPKYVVSSTLQEPEWTRDAARPRFQTKQLKPPQLTAILQALYFGQDSSRSITPVPGSGGVGQVDGDMALSTSPEVPVCWRLNATSRETA